MDIKFNIPPCGFCNGTGIEPGETNCVWCDNTGIDWAGSPGDVPVVDAPPRNLLREALEHIQKTVGQSRTQTRRLRWIGKRAELALAGRPYVASEHELPPNGDREHFKLLRQKAALKERVDFLEGLLTDQVAQIDLVISSLEFDEKLHGSNPERSTLDFPHAIRILNRVKAALKSADVVEAPNEPCRYPNGIMCPGDGTGKACAKCPMQGWRP